MRRLSPSKARGLLTPWRWLRRLIGPEALYKHASDYGNSFAKPAWWLVAVLFAAFLLFPVPGLERRLPQPGPTVSYLNVWYKQDIWTNNLWSEGKLLGKSFIAAVDTATFQRNPEYTPAYPWGRVLAILETLLISTLFGLFLLAIRRRFKR